MKNLTLDNNPNSYNSPYINAIFRLIEKYSRDFYQYKDIGQNPFDINDLINDLKDYLKYLSVEIITIDKDLNLDPFVCNNFKSILSDQIVKQFRLELEKSHISEKFSGKTLPIYDSEKIFGHESLDIDVIPLPGKINFDNHKSVICLFILIDSKKMSCITETEINFQRNLLAHFLRDWWLKITPFSGSLEYNLIDHNNEQNQIKFSTWFYYVPINELVQLGLNASNNIRNSNLKHFFHKESKNRKFNFDLWNPPLCFVNKDNSQKVKLRESARTLIYFCSWINSHKDLEENNQKRKITKIFDWLKTQRKFFNEIENHLNILQNLCASDFSERNFRFCQMLTLKKSDDSHLTLERNNLLIFFLFNWIKKDSVLRKELKSDLLSNTEFCRDLHAIGTISHHLFCQQPLSDDFIHRIMQIISKIGHSEFGIPARIDLRAHLLHAIRGEPALYSLKSFYRDHFFHAIQVCLLGHILLETKINDQLYLWQIVSNCLNIKKNKNNVLKLWYTASLLHDIGYAVEIFNLSQKHLKFFKHSEALKNFINGIKENKSRLLEEHELHNIGVNFSKGMENDHGIIGAIHLLSLIENISKEDKNLKIDEFQPAIQAIAMHNLRKENDKIVFSSNPIAFLLAFCDQIQEWNRLGMPFSTSPNIIISRLNQNKGTKTNYWGGHSNVKANINSSLNGEELNMQLADSNLLDISLNFDKNINKNSSIFNLWLDSTLNFQRLDFDGLPFNIRVNYISPYYKEIDNVHEIRQLYRLRNAAHETHMTFLSDWFPKNEVVGSPNKLTNGAVDYEFDDANKKETLSLNLRELSQKRLMTKDMGFFYKRLSEWKYFNEDRDFPGDYVEVIPE